MQRDFFCNTYEFKLDKLEHLDKKSNKCSFSGYASLFNVLDHHNDVILQGTFQDVGLKEKCILLWQHDSSKPIGKITNIKEDTKGLYVKGELCLGIRLANDVYHMLKDDILNSLSIGYTPIDYEYGIHDNGSKVRFIKSAKLWEVSLVTFPANEGAKITNIKNNGFYNQYHAMEKNCDDKNNDEDVYEKLTSLLMKMLNK
jgi:HK97 family phage prohead protease